MKKKKSEDFVTTISVTKFNENISKYIQQAESAEGEVIYIEKRGMTRVVMLSKTMFDMVMKGYLEFQKTKNGLN